MDVSNDDSHQNPSRPPLLQFLDELSARERSELLELLFTAYAYRQAIATPSEKFTGRTAMKSLAELLARVDAEWRVRDFVLNSGRALYYSPATEHPYYRDGLIELVTKIAKDVGRPNDGATFAKAVERASGDSAGASAFAIGEVLETQQILVQAATQIIESALQKLGAAHFTRSEAKMLSGVVTRATAAKLHAPFDPARAQIRHALAGDTPNGGASNSSTSKRRRK